MTAAPRTRWLVTPAARPQATRRVVAFAHAGGTPLAYAGWVPQLPLDVELVTPLFPGRLERLAEPPATRAEELLPHLLEALDALPPKPTALFGVSLGALMAFRTAQVLEQRGTPAELLVVSAMRPPHLLDAMLEGEPVAGLRHHTLERVRRDLWAELRMMGMVVDSAKNRALLEPLLPAIRADYEVFGAFAADPTPLQRTPLAAFFGDDDRWTPPQAMAEWDRWGPLLETQRFHGGHFFAYHRAQDTVRALLRRWDGLRVRT